VKTYLYDAADRIHKFGKDAINAFADGDEQRMMLLGSSDLPKQNHSIVKMPVEISLINY
jgi:hypothetical protein